MARRIYKEPISFLPPPPNLKGLQVGDGAWGRGRKLSSKASSPFPGVSDPKLTERFMIMETRTALVLEFDKLLAHLADFAVSDTGKAAIRGLAPCAGSAELYHHTSLFEQTRHWAEANTFALGDFPDLSGVLAFLNSRNTALDIDALWALRKVLAQIKAARDAILSSGENAPWPLLLDLAGGYSHPASTESALLRCISDDGIIRDESSPELMLVRTQMRGIHQQCAVKVKEFARVHNIAHYLQDEFMTLSSDRYVLPFKSNFKGRLQGIIHDYSQTGETFYFEPYFLVELNNDLQNLKREEQEEERKILAYLTELARQEQAGVAAGYDFLCQMDVLLAKCKLAAAFDGRMVGFAPEFPVCLKDARHPLLALSLPPGEVVPVDIELKSGQRGLVLSGGNAGGKTVCLKTLGLVTLMGLSALPVPVAAGSTLPLWRQVFAFIGDEQSLSDRLSTYTAQIEHLARAWPHIDHTALVILDEFGAGTDPTQGAALAQAVLDSILETGGHVAAATHFPSLKAYALSQEGIRAASVLFDPSSKKPLYKVVYDQVGASLALDVARKHGLPEAILRRAERNLLQGGEDTASLLDRLNALALKKEDELAGLRREKENFAAKRTRLQEKFEAEQKRLLDDLQRQSQGILAEWKSARVTAKQAMKELARTRTQIAELGSSQPEAGKQAGGLDFSALAPGQTVRYLPWNRNGVIEALDSRKSKLKLDFNGVSVWVDEREIATSDGPAAKDYTATSKTPSPKSTEIIQTENTPTDETVFTPGMRIDLRGQTADLALPELAYFLDQAMLRGVHNLEIIHGRGTGALRREVHAFLKDFKGVAAFSVANEDAGGDGVTLVRLA